MNTNFYSVWFDPTENQIQYRYDFDSVMYHFSKLKL